MIGKGTALGVMRSKGLVAGHSSGRHARLARPYLRRIQIGALEKHLCHKGGKESHSLAQFVGTGAGLHDLVEASLW